MHLHTYMYMKISSKILRCLRVIFVSLYVDSSMMCYPSAGSLVEGCTFHIANKCPFPIWPAITPNAGHPVVADGGFFLTSGQVKRVQTPATWNGRFWARTGCNFASNSKHSCQTGDCQGLLSCNGSIGLPPATLVEVPSL